MKKVSLFKKVVLGTGLLLCATSMSARTIFVAANGSWESDGSSSSNPAKFANAMLNGDEGEEGIMKSGDKIVVMPGTQQIEGTINIEGLDVEFIGYQTIDDVDFTATGNSIIDGKGTQRLFNITGSSQVKFAHLTFQNASSAANGGSAITADASIVDIGNCGFLANKAQGATDAIGAYGGAIKAVSGSTLNLYNVTFDGNTAFRGGAVSVNGSTMKAEYCFFWSNSTVYNDGEARGGAVFASDANLNFNFCDIKGNTSLRQGGAFFIVGDSKTEIKHSGITGNHSGTGYNSETETGETDNHGGVFCIFGAPKTTIINSTIGNNYAAGPNAVGGILYGGGDEFTLINVTVTNNYTDGNIDHCGAFNFGSAMTAINIFNSIIERNKTNSDHNWSDINITGLATVVTVEGSVCGSTKAAEPDNIFSDDGTYLKYSYDPLPYSDPLDDPLGDPNKNVSGITINGMKKTCFPLQASAVAKGIGIALLLPGDGGKYYDQYLNERIPADGTIYAGAVQILESEDEKLNPQLAPANPYYDPFMTTGLSDVATDGNDATVVGYYTILGQKLNKEPESGVFILQYSDGKFVKVLK